MYPTALQPLLALLCLACVVNYSIPQKLPIFENIKVLYFEKIKPGIICNYFVVICLYVVLDFIMVSPLTVWTRGDR
jgi:hypothetical protein